MHGANEIIPRMTRGQFANPFLLAWQIINLKREPNRKLWKLLPRVAHLLDVFIQLIETHTPVVKIIPPHRRVVRETDFRKAEFEGAPGVIHGFAGCVTAKRRVHVQVGRKSHGLSFKFRLGRFKRESQTGLTVALLFLYFHTAKAVRFAPNANSGIFISEPAVSNRFRFVA